ncbi:MAG: hypothetical protein AB7F43_13525 [Bacteriovoracia bacterium]
MGGSISRVLWLWLFLGFSLAWAIEGLPKEGLLSEPEIIYPPETQEQILAVDALAKKIVELRAPYAQIDAEAQKTVELVRQLEKKAPAILDQPLSYKESSKIMRQLGSEFGSINAEIRNLQWQSKTKANYLFHGKMAPEIQDKIQYLKASAVLKLRQGLGIVLKTQTKLDRWRDWLEKNETKISVAIIGIVIEAFTMSVAIGAEYVVNYGSWTELFQIVGVTMGVSLVPPALYLILENWVNKVSLNGLWDTFFSSANQSGFESGVLGWFSRFYRGSIVENLFSYPRDYLYCTAALRGLVDRTKKTSPQPSSR